LEISYVIRDITPPVGIRLGGYGHRFNKRSTHIVSPLYLRLLELIDPYGESFVLLQMDLLGIYLEDSQKIKKILSSKLSVKEDNIMITTTHTHSSPETIIPMWRKTFPYTDEEKDFFNRWWRRVYIEIENAAEKINIYRERIRRTFVARGSLDQLCYNRAFIDGEIDPDLTILGVESEKDKILIVNYTCHPVTNTGLGISSDYPGELYYYMRRYGYETIFLTGAAGDIDPLSKGLRYMRYMGEMLGQKTLSISSAHAKDIKIDEIKIRTYSMELSIRKPEKDVKELLKYYYTMLSNYDTKTLTEDLYYDPTWIDLLYIDEEIDIAERFGDKIKTIIQVASLGDMIILAVPGEMLVETGLVLKRYSEKNNYVTTMISAYTNDYVGYIPIERSFRENKYEARLAKWSILGPDAEKIFLEKYMNIIKELRHE